MSHEQLADRLGEDICLVVGPAEMAHAPAPIHAKEYMLSKVFGGDFAFRVSFAERPYCWTKKQAGDLLDDLLDMLDSDPEKPIGEFSPYFLGSFVLIKEENAPESKIVEGQQRLITLTLLLSALKETIEDRAIAEDLTPFLYARGNKVLGTSNRNRLVMPDPDRDYFETHIIEAGGLMKAAKLILSRAESSSQENLWANGLLFHGRLQALSEATRRRLATFLLTRCFVIVVSSPALGADARDGEHSGTAT